MFEGQERFLISNDWITLIFMINLLLIGIVKFAFNERFTKLFSLLYSEKYYSDYSKTNPLIFNPFNTIFFIVSIFNISLLIYFYFDIFKSQNIDYNLFFFLRIFLGVIFYILVRFIIGFLLGIIFDKQDEQKYLTFLKISNISLFSIYLFSLLIIINYTALSHHRFIFIAGAFLLFIFIISRYFSMLKNSKINFHSLFYLFLYLCALEITPFIVVYKLFIL